MPGVPARSHRRGPLVFVSVFISIVLAALSAYHFATDSKANDYYLYILAQHTAWVLDLIGESCKVESYYGGTQEAGQIRATIAAWESGADSASQDAVAAASEAPLTSWERWRYKALEQRRRGKTGEMGPNVQFVLQPDLNIRMRTLRESIKALRNDQALDAAERDRQIQAAEAELKELQTESRALLKKPLAQRKTGKVFAFNLVPSCGAVEVISIFVAAVIAFPATWRKRAWGLALGLPLLYAVNVLRIAFLAIVGALDSYERVWFNFLHEYVWQAVYIIFVVAAWLAWVEYLVRRNR